MMCPLTFNVLVSGGRVLYSEVIIVEAEGITAEAVANRCAASRPDNCPLPTTQSFGHPSHHLPASLVAGDLWLLPGKMFRKV